MSKIAREFARTEFRHVVLYHFVQILRTSREFSNSQSQLVLFTLTNGWEVFYHEFFAMIEGYMGRLEVTLHSLPVTWEFKKVVKSLSNGLLLSLTFV